MANCVRHFGNVFDAWVHLLITITRYVLLNQLFD